MGVIGSSLSRGAHSQMINASYRGVKMRNYSVGMSTKRIPNTLFDRTGMKNVTWFRSDGLIVFINCKKFKMYEGPGRVRDGHIEYHNKKGDCVRVPVWGASPKYYTASELVKFYKRAGG